MNFQSVYCDCGTINFTKGSVQAKLKGIFRDITETGK